MCSLKELTYCFGLIYHIFASNEKMIHMQPIPHLDFVNRDIEEMQLCFDRGKFKCFYYLLLNY